MLSNVDAVHGLYYLLMHGWFQVFPPTEFWSRAPSGLAVGGAAAGVVVLGKQFSSRTVAVSSGVICGILPRATWAGIEARPYALSMMAAVWLTVLLVHAARRNSAWVWLAYGIVLATSILLDVYLALMLLAHVAFLCLCWRSRTVLVRFAITSVLAVLCCDAVCASQPSAKCIRSFGSHRLGAGRSKMSRFNNISREARRSRSCRHWSWRRLLSCGSSHPRDWCRRTGSC